MTIGSPKRLSTRDEPDALVREARARQRRRQAIGAAAVAAMAGIVLIANGFTNRTLQPRVTTSGVVPAPAASCRSSQLRISLVHTGAVTGEEGGLLRFTNLSRTPCMLTGWPTVVAVEPSGTRITSHHAVTGTMLFGWVGSPGHPLPKIRLRQRSSAYAILADGDNPAGGSPARPCPTARRLRVSPPRDRTTTSLSAWLPNDVTWLPLCLNAYHRPELAVSPLLRLPPVVQ